MTDPARRTSILQDIVAHTGVPLLLSSLILRMAADRTGTHPGHPTIAWIAQGLTLLCLLVGIAIAVLRKDRPSPGMWLLPAVWTFGTGVAVLHDLP
ncbi:hypothetical protein [Kitasatospora sp. NPDC005751]|uniref:hypothetical protein n=1 Tax=Kitasatospora sp. NPDC005751 TaxID=3157064 RepID=UPI0033D88D26